MSTRLVALSKAAEMLGVSVYTVRRLIARGNLIAVNVGARRLIAESEIDRIIQRGIGKPRPTKTSRAAS